MAGTDHRLFAAIVAGGSLSAAGRALGISAPMVSKRLARLEDRLGSQLVRRTTRRLELTDAGLRFHADIVAISAHPFTTCGVLKEMQRQGVKPKVLVGLTSSSSMETLQGCAAQAEGILIPTSFAPVTPEAKKAADALQAVGTNMDLHNAAAWENIYTLKDLIEKKGIVGKPETVQADRAKMREALAALKQTQGLIGPLGRGDDREAIKPFLFVQAKSGQWTVAHRPANQ